MLRPRINLYDGLEGAGEVLFPNKLDVSTKVPFKGRAAANHSAVHPV